MKKLLIILLAIFVASLFIVCQPKFDLTITIVGTGAVTADGAAVTSGTAIVFNGNEEVELVVTPGNGFQFQGWSGTNSADVTGTGPYTILMNEAKAITATFVTANDAPTATVQAITGTAQVGQTLTGHYTYADTESDPEGTSTFRWLSSDTETGVYAPITGATAITYVLQSADENNYIKFEVTPVATTGTLTGTPVQSAAVGPVISATAISVSAAPTTLFEAFANDGSLDPNTVTLTVANSTFIQAQVTLANITATGLPTGLSLANPTYTDATHVTVQVSGNAAAHQNSNDTTFTITVAAAAITDATANCTTNVIAIDFVDAPVAPVEDWETNTFTKYPWLLGGNVIPVLTDTQNNTTGGTYSERGGVITHSQTSYISINANVPVAGDMTFYFLASTESTTVATGYDGLRIFVDGSIIDHLDNFDCGGDATTACTVWTQYTVPLTVGNHSVVFQYRRDGTGDFGDNTVYLDDIVFPMGTTLSAPQPEILVASSVSPLTEIPNGGTYNAGQVALGATTGNTRTIYIVNVGPAELQLTGDPYVTVSGDTALTVTTQPVAGTFGFNTYVTAVCTIDTTNAGTFTSTLTIPNNDSNENPYTVNVAYSVVPPYSEIELRRDPFGTIDAIASGGTYDGGTVISNTGATKAFTFRIYNVGLGTSPLDLTGTPKVNKTSGDTQIAVTTQPTTGTIPTTGTNYKFFIVTYTGDGVTGPLSATFEIVNDETGHTGLGDNINEQTYTFTINLTSLAPTIIDDFQGYAAGSAPTVAPIGSTWTVGVQTDQTGGTGVVVANVSSSLRLKLLYGASGAGVLGASYGTTATGYSYAQITFTPAANGHLNFDFTSNDWGAADSIQFWKDLDIADIASPGSPADWTGTIAASTTTTTITIPDLVSGTTYRLTWKASKATAGQDEDDILIDNIYFFND